MISLFVFFTKTFCRSFQLIAVCSPGASPSSCLVDSLNGCRSGTTACTIPSSFSTSLRLRCFFGLSCRFWFPFLSWRASLMLLKEVNYRPVVSKAAGASGLFTKKPDAFSYQKTSHFTALICFLVHIQNHVCFKASLSMPKKNLLPLCRYCHEWQKEGLWLFGVPAIPLMCIHQPSRRCTIKSRNMEHARIGWTTDYVVRFLEQ